MTPMMLVLYLLVIVALASAQLFKGEVQLNPNLGENGVPQYSNRITPNNEIERPRPLYTIANTQRTQSYVPSSCRPTSSRTSTLS